MSNDFNKPDTIAYRLYTKLVSVVNHARTTGTGDLPSQNKVDKWFNLETPEVDILKEHTRIYRHISQLHHPPLFQLQVLLCVPELTNNQVLVYLAPDSSRKRIDPTPKYIVLESWDLSFAPRDSEHGQDDINAPTMYKHAIPLFRSIFTLSRILPAWKLARPLRGRGGGNRNGHFGIQLRVQGYDNDAIGEVKLSDVMGFDTPPAPGATPLPKGTYTFPSIGHPLGAINLSLTYLTAPNFRLDELESLLSSRFLSDEEYEFTPTLVRNQQRESISGSPGSLPIKTSLPRSPVTSSVADRFVVPPAMHTRTTSFPTLGGSSPRMQPMALPAARHPSNAGAMGSASGLSDASSRQGGVSTGSREEFPSVYSLAARMRRGSMNANRGTDPSSPAGSLPIRHPPLGPVNAFKSPTMSSGSPSLHSPSPSLRQHSPLSGGITGPSLPARPAHTSPTSSRAAGAPSSVMTGVSAGSRGPSSPVAPFRPSPPYAPSSLGDRRSLASAEGAPSEGSPRAGGKRYSSSFGHRFTQAGGATSEGSPGSGPKDGEKVASGSFLSSHTDDDDITAFVQEIDARKPLGGRDQHGGTGSESGPPSPRPSHQRSTSESPASEGGSTRLRTASVSSPMLATESAVDERLRAMHEQFEASLQGFGRAPRRRDRERERSSGDASTVGRARAPTMAPLTTFGQRADPMDFGRRQEGTQLEGARVMGGVVPLPSQYVRPRFASTGSARSGMSIASEEVLGRMDPEVGDDRHRSRT